MNFSEIGKLPPPQQQAILFEAISQIELGAMPLPAYERLHPGSMITPEQLAILKQYVDPARPQSAATVAEIDAADAQYVKWIQSDSATSSVAPAPNGIAFLPEYKNWKAISSTARFDNHTLTQILGNDVAVKAIAENHINPEAGNRPEKPDPERPNGVSSLSTSSCDAMRGACKRISRPLRYLSTQLGHGLRYNDSVHVLPGRNQIHDSKLDTASG